MEPVIDTPAHDFAGAIAMRNAFQEAIKMHGHQNNFQMILI